MNSIDQMINSSGRNKCFRFLSPCENFFSERVIPVIIISVLVSNVDRVDNLTNMTNLQMSFIPRWKVRIVRRASMIEFASSFKETSEFKDDDRVCYCFGYTRKDIEKDYLTNCRSTIAEKITSEKKAGGCDCAQKHPNGR